MFIVKGNLVVSDPCYSLGTWCATVIENPVLGEWECDCYNDHLIAWAKGCRDMIKDCGIDPTVDLGVDSGQMAIWNESDWNPPKDGQIEPGDWYRAICENTNPIYETLHGCASRTTYGDGSYELALHKNEDGLVDAICIDFDPEEEEE